jgi:hypothetical protein
VVWRSTIPLGGSYQRDSALLLISFMNLANDSALGIVRVLPPIRHEMKYGDAWSVAVETGFLIIGDRPSTSALKARTMPNRDN